MQQRKNTHLERRRELETERAAARGDPVRGLTTPFVESFDSAGQAPLSKSPLDDNGNPIADPHPLPTSPHVLNNLIHQDELEAALATAYELTRKEFIELDGPPSSPPSPAEGERAEGGVVAAAEARTGAGEPGSGVDGALSIAGEAAARADPDKARREREAQEAAHAKAAEAVRRIVHLDAGSAKDRKLANVRRIVETFGRHVTDADPSIPPRAPARGHEPKEAVEGEDESEKPAEPVRAGPDTGSSEVQIALLTAKIRALANALETGRGYKDKIGKRNLRLLVHRRQRLLQYMERKERGSGRWRHLVETLGLSEATYKGQITL